MWSASQIAFHSRMRLNEVLGMDATTVDIGSGLAAIQRLVDHLFCEPLTIGHFFGAERLDRFCQELGRRNLQQLRLPTSQRNAHAGPVVYIASKLHISGGHTAALLDVIRLSPEKCAVVLVTETCGRTAREQLRLRFGSESRAKLEFVPPGGHAAKLSWLQARLHELGPAKVWLFNHHQDSVAVAAVQPGQAYELRFYHHGDDRLCLGARLDFGTHFDPIPAAVHNCTALRNGHRSHYLPLVAVDAGYAGARLTAPWNRPLVTCTAAGYNKVEVEYFVQYVDVVPELLKITGGRHIHIGRLSRLAQWRIGQGLRRRGIPTDAFLYIPWVPSVWRTLQTEGVDLYFASFPYGGGRTLVEVMGAGVPAILHRHTTVRMIGGFDMAYDEALTWREPRELYDKLRQVNPDFLVLQGKLARAWYERYHDESVLAGALRDPTSVIAPDPKPGYVPDELLSAWQAASEVTWNGLLKRTAVRAFRRASSALGRMA